MSETAQARAKNPLHEFASNALQFLSSLSGWVFFQRDRETNVMKAVFCFSLKRYRLLLILLFFSQFSLYLIHSNSMSLGVNSMSPSHEAVLWAVGSMNRVSGYNPTIGEVAKVAGVSYGVCTRCLEKLCGAGFIETETNVKARIKYRFATTSDGSYYLVKKGRL